MYDSLKILLLGAGRVVTKSFPSYSAIACVPTKVIFLRGRELLSVSEDSKEQIH